MTLGGKGGGGGGGQEETSSNYSRVSLLKGGDLYIACKLISKLAVIDQQN